MNRHTTIFEDLKNVFTEMTNILRCFDSVKCLYVFLDVLKELDFDVVIYQLKDVEIENFLKFFRTLLRSIIFFSKYLTSVERNY